MRIGARASSPARTRLTFVLRGPGRPPAGRGHRRPRRRRRHRAVPRDPQAARHPVPRRGAARRRRIPTGTPTATRWPRSRRADRRVGPAGRRSWCSRARIPRLADGATSSSVISSPAADVGDEIALVRLPVIGRSPGPATSPCCASSTICPTTRSSSASARPIASSPGDPLGAERPLRRSSCAVGALRPDLRGGSRHAPGSRRSAAVIGLDTRRARSSGLFSRSPFVGGLGIVGEVVAARCTHRCRSVNRTVSGSVSG